MTTIEEYQAKLQADTIIRGPLFPEPVQVIMTKPMGNSLKLIGNGVNTNQTYQPILSLAQLSALEFSPETEPFDGQARNFRLAIEAQRLALAYEYDPYFSLSIARVDPLPHQLEAVYDYFLKLPRIRFLLADDPGAGKTIMAGLLIKELKIRGLIKRVLIVTPANLSFQWQREMQDRFQEKFRVIRSDVLRAHYGSNPWQEYDQVITSVSWVSRIDDARESLLRASWDLIVVDEAHKMSAYGSGNKVKKTKAYMLGEELSQRTDHFLLATATPHKGDAHNFSLFLKLLDADVYGDISSLEEAMKNNEAPFYLRRVKEALVKFPDPNTGETQSLFTKRIVNTAGFMLNDTEWDFYNSLTGFVEEQSRRAAEDDSLKGRALGFTMAMLQRRFASSLYAVRRTLERMKQTREKILADPEGYRQKKINQRVPDDFDDLREIEQEEILAALEEIVDSVDPDALRAEIADLSQLVRQAEQLEQKGNVESKLTKLKQIITDEGVFNDPDMRLLIFTEHKDTLHYLVEKLRAWGLSVTQIYGGMQSGDRNTPGTRLYAEREFRETCQIMVATEAAGEGINLQFCWLMINYDIPWNPVRLEQRMGRIHRYGQEKDCLIFNFVALNTKEGEVLERLFDRIAQIETDLDPQRTGKVFNVLGDVFPSNQLERWIRDMYATNLTDQAIKDRIVERVDTEHMQSIIDSTLEGLAKRELNLAAITKNATEAKEHRLVPEVIEDFFTEAGPLVGVTPTALKTPHVYKVGRIPRHLWATGERLESSYGKLDHSYGQITFDKAVLTKQATLEWVTPGHALFETVREAVSEQVADDLQRGTIFYDLQSEDTVRLDVFTAAISDGRGKVIERRLLVVQIALDGSLSVRSPQLFLDLSAAADSPALPDMENLPTQVHIEQFLIENSLNQLLEQVTTSRTKELDTIEHHLNISMTAIIDRVQRQYGELFAKREAGSTESGLEGRLKQMDERLMSLNNRLEKRQAELHQERQCMLGDIRLLGRAWVLPHPERNSDELAPLVENDTIEQVAIQTATAYEQERGCQVNSVEAENKGYDLISREPHPHDPGTFAQTRRIEVKGRAGEGGIIMTPNEYQTARKLGQDYWLYVVFDCDTDTPRLEIINNPAQLVWHNMPQLDRYQLNAKVIKHEAKQQREQKPTEVQLAMEQILAEWEKQLGKYNILVEGLSDKVYLELAAQRHLDAHGVDLLNEGQIRIIAGTGTKKFAPYFGILQQLERQRQGFKFVVLLDGDGPGQSAASAMDKFGAQKNTHFFQLTHPDYRDKGGTMWDVEIEDMLPYHLIKSFIEQYPKAVEQSFMQWKGKQQIHKVVIQGKPQEIDGQTFDFKMMLTDHIRHHATAADLTMLIDVLKKARKCMKIR
ncbi:DUF3883 domain-containing protein [Anaerolineales bacterium HSG25]|nr:DUF3883 domain-containing protein [Anaerolineales bacterium HSG25]